MSELAYLADARRERWLRQVQAARAAGEVACILYAVPQAQPAQVIEFPERPDPNPPEVVA